MGDATTVKVRDALLDEFPQTGSDAAINVHTVLSVGRGAPVHDHCSPAREHDSRHLTIEESWRDCGLLADLASARRDRLRACQAHGVQCVIRLKDHWQPTGDDLARGHLTPEFFPGTDLDALIEVDLLVLDGRAIAADVPVGRGPHALPLRLAGVHTPTGSGVFLTNLAPRLGPWQVADLFRVRWEVELSLRLDQSVHRLDQLDAARPCSVKTLLHTARLAALLAHTHHG